MHRNRDRPSDRATTQFRIVHLFKYFKKVSKFYEVRREKGRRRQEVRKTSYFRNFNRDKR